MQPPLAIAAATVQGTIAALRPVCHPVRKSLMNEYADNVNTKNKYFFIFFILFMFRIYGTCAPICGVFRYS